MLLMLIISRDTIKKLLKIIYSFQRIARYLGPVQYQFLQTAKEGNGMIDFKEPKNDNGGKERCGLEATCGSKSTRI